MAVGSTFHSASVLWPTCFQNAFSGRELDVRNYIQLRKHFGPVAGGWYMQIFHNSNLFYLITCVMVLIWIGVLFGKRRKRRSRTI
ncbi:hypothetical protein PO124_16730 [Bacillus licheniformis]|nr:hypothetical protein [Bacillus licheniformis]